MHMSLDSVRAEITKVDDGILQLIARRQELAVEIAKIKNSRGMPIRDDRRANEVIGSVFDRAVELKIDPVATQKIFEMLIAMSEERQRGCSGEGNLP